MTALGDWLKGEPVLLGAALDAGIQAVVLPQDGVSEATKGLLFAFTTAVIAWVVRSLSKPKAQAAAETAAAVSTAVEHTEQRVDAFLQGVATPAPRKAKAAKK